MSESEVWKVTRSDAESAITKWARREFEGANLKSPLSAAFTGVAPGGDAPTISITPNDRDHYLVEKALRKIGSPLMILRKLLAHCYLHHQRPETFKLFGVARTPYPKELQELGYGRDDSYLKRHAIKRVVRQVTAEIEEWRRQNPDWQKEAPAA